MRVELLSLLRCPESGQRLSLESGGTSICRGQVDTGYLVSTDGRHRYPIRTGIPRFVPESNYADNFGMQWNIFARTQLDSSSGQSISAERFWKATLWHPASLRDRWVLDVGCGSGRFAEIALGAGAKVVALDYSSAADACYANLRHHDNLHVVQGDIYCLPFAPESFDFVYSLGVLQHTPDVGRAFAALPPMLANEGRLCVDYYERSLKGGLLPKYWLRPITTRLPKTLLFAILERLVPVLLPVSQAISRVPVIGPLLQRAVPVANYKGIYSLNDTQLSEWALLDTFDMLAPAFDQPQTAKIARTWLESAGLFDISVEKAGHLVARGTKR